MTKKQGVTLDRVITAAFDVLNRNGADKLSTRAVAAELGVSMNTVIWHIGTKDRLLELMADAIVGEVDLRDLPESWSKRTAELLRRLRRALLRHHDGALIVAGTFPAEPHTLGFADCVVAALLEQSPTRRYAAWTMWSLFYFTLGLVQEEQSAPSTWHEHFGEDAGGIDKFPNLRSVRWEFQPTDFGERFDFGIDQILCSVRMVE